MRILFDSKDRRFKDPFGTLTPGKTCRMTVHIPSGIRPEALLLVLEREDGSEYARLSGERDGTEGAYDLFSVRFSLEDAGLYFYYFRITTRGEDFALFREGWDQTNMEAGDKWQLSVIPADFHTPRDWYGYVMYQIFPDRFAKKGDCDVTGKLEPFRLHEDLRDTPSFEPDETGEVKNCDFFGGNLAGIEEKLPYLKDLGVSVLYLNPIFKAWSNHRYDTANYLKIDELLGTEEDFRSLCRAAHRLGMKVILDGVFSHTGSRSVYFDAQGEFGTGAASDPDSPYREWFEFSRFPDEYTTWWGMKTLPCVDEMNEGYQRYIITGEDSVVAHWLRAGADGFRLDVADELPDAFIRRLRRRLKEIDPDALLIGEVWEDASHKISYGKRRTYFTAGELDSVMNYPWRDAILSYASGLDSGEGLCRAVMTLAENYPPQVLPLLMNMLSTHDTARVLSVLSPKPAPAEKKERSRYRMGEEEKKVALSRFYTASFLQFVLPGMPCVYYGDEIGMEGYEDPFCRAYFPWEKAQKSEERAFLRALARLRKQESILRRGEVFARSDGEGRVFVERTLEGKSLLALTNTGEDYSFHPAGEVLFSHNAVEKDGRYTLRQNGFLLCRLS